jgi:LuxR family maltose regulon positive regulatory protein
LPEAFVLCLDDYHAIEDEVVDQLLAALIDNLPANVHLAMATRVDPRLNLTRLRVNQQMIQIRMDDLRLRQDEVRTFVESSIGTTLSETALALLVERTEGWVGGLRLAVLSMRGIENPEAFVYAFTGTHRDLTDYLINEVLSHQTKTVQDFLLRTSILDRFCAPLCDAVCFSSAVLDEGPLDMAVGEHSSTGIRRSSASQGILKALERANLFLVPLDYERDWYRYHHLFQELLRHRLYVALSEEEINSLHRRASTWYEREGYIEEALRHSIKAGDLLAASQLVEKHRHTLINDDEFHTLERWLKLIPEEMVQTRPSMMRRCPKRRVLYCRRRWMRSLVKPCISRAMSRVRWQPAGVRCSICPPPITSGGAWPWTFTVWLCRRKGRWKRPSEC